MKSFVELISELNFILGPAEVRWMSYILYFHFGLLTQRGLEAYISYDVWEMFSENSIK